MHGAPKRDKMFLPRWGPESPQILPVRSAQRNVEDGGTLLLAPGAIRHVVKKFGEARD